MILSGPSFLGGGEPQEGWHCTLFISEITCLAHAGCQEGAWTSELQLPPFSDGCGSPHFLPGRHSPLSTWDLSKANPHHATPNSNHFFWEVFSNPSPGSHLPLGYAMQPPSYTIHLFAGCLPSNCLSRMAGSMMILFITVDPLPAQA